MEDSRATCCTAKAVHCPARALGGERDTVLASTAVNHFFLVPTLPLSHLLISQGCPARCACPAQSAEGSSEQQPVTPRHHSGCPLSGCCELQCMHYSRRKFVSQLQHAYVHTHVHALLASRSCTYWFHPLHPLPPVCWPPCWNSEVKYVRSQRPGSLCAAQHAGQGHQHCFGRTEVGC